jgi:hypothetical protein
MDSNKVIPNMARAIDAIKFLIPSDMFHPPAE